MFSKRPRLELTPPNSSPTLQNSSRDAFQSGNSDDNNINDDSSDNSDNNDEDDESEHSENREGCIVSRWRNEFLKSWPWLIYNTQTDTATCRYRECRMYSPFLILLM